MALDKSVHDDELISVSSSRPPGLDRLRILSFKISNL
jgi:hypothetical protein